MNTERSIERFRNAIQIDTSWPSSENLTETHEESRTDASLSPAEQKALSALKQFQNFLQEAYPAFNRVAERIVLNPFCVLYRWPGIQNAADESLPVLFLAHYDVVPVDRELWTVDPFGAEIKEGYIYGRGTLDTKNTLICAMEAAEALAERGFVPQRDIWFAFGGDEERSGAHGAQNAASWFRERNMAFSWLLDEGSIVALNQIPGVQVPLALIGVEEKGFLDIELLVRQAPGHASRPPERQAVAVLAEALVRLSKRPFPYKLIPSVESFFTSLAPLVDTSTPKGVLQSLVLRNSRRLGPLFYPLAGTSPATRALLRTTLAMTQLFGAKADNILPAEARAILNLRLLPGDTIESALDYVRRAIGMDEVIVRPSPYRSANNPVLADKGSPAGLYHGPGWQALVEALSVTFPQAKPIPFLVTATTDSRHYADLCRAVYRFGPLELPPAEVDRIHGHDERISLENLQRGIAFYQRLIEGL
ncbi:M20/M25/M40 family metallo-hydrolase [Gracilinema caldarium]|uniref:M20/M25/M40 family metallo-hydrolase n=1 Tax=Gracilinema caldarium TaxID=215591 RepID=UPI0026F0A3A9|nr:M20/M25/M40 family metallo-hydrolase [Gracilinema caldarium]